MHTRSRTFRLTDDEYTALSDLAAAQERSVNDTLRRLLRSLNDPIPTLTPNVSASPAPPRQQPARTTPSPQDDYRSARASRLKQRE